MVSLIADRQKMIDFIASQVGDEATFTLANGPDGAITAHVMAYDDEIVISSNCPEWASVREIYRHLRWHTMPAWEQWQWLRGQASLAMGDAYLKYHEEHLARYRFQQVGEIIVVHFPEGGEVKRTLFKSHRGLLHFRALLNRADRPIKCIELAGEANVETEMLIASQRNWSNQNPLDDWTLDTFRNAHNILKDRYSAARERGDIDAMTRAEEEIEQFELLMGKDEKEFLRRNRRTEQGSALERTMYKTVHTAMRRALKNLREQGMNDCANHLERYVRPEGFAFAYRPPTESSPDWLL